VGAGVAGYGGFLTNSALGVAGQAVIGSLVSGLALVVDPEFNVGDFIEWAEGEGTVQSITLRVTRVRTPDGELVTVPNTMLAEQAIARRYGDGSHRIVEHVGLSYDDDVDGALAVLESAAGVTVSPPSERELQGRIAAEDAA
jgi:small-conductance mechanosensitive channel